MKRLIGICISAVAIILFTTAVSFAQTTEKADKVDNSDFKVLEERVKQNEEKTDIRFDAIKDEVKIRSDAARKELEIKTVEIENRIELYKWFAGIIAALIVTLLSLIGYKTINAAIDEAIEKKTVDELEASWGDSFKRFSDKKAIELDEKWEERFKAIEKKWGARHKELEDKWTDYENSLKKAMAKIESDKGFRSISEIPPEELEEFIIRLEDVKQEKEYSPEDWLIKAVNEQDKGNLKTAIEYYSKAIDKNPREASAYNNRGSCYNSLNKFKKSIGDFNKAIELEPEDMAAYHNRAYSYTHLKKYKKAIDDYNEAIALKPDDWHPISGLATVYILTGSYEDALKRIEKALTLDLDHEARATLYYKKCIITKLLDLDTTEAEKEFAAALEKEFVLAFSFVAITNWLSKTDLPPDTKRFIEEKMKMLKKKKK